MSSRLKTLIDLLHTPGDISLATHSVTIPGYPFNTSVAFATDEHHCPLGKQVLDAPQITLEDEASLIDGIKSKLREGMALLGVDAYGVDYCADGVRKRVEFKAGSVLADAAKAALARVVKNL